MSFFLVILVLMGSWIGFGTTLSQADLKAFSEQPEFTYDLHTKLFNSLPFGNHAAILRFMTNQIRYLSVGVYQQNGTGGYDNTRPPHHIQADETLEEFIQRAAVNEFRFVVEKNNYKLNQRFEITFFFLNGIGEPLAFNMGITFLPHDDGAGYTVPNDIGIGLPLTPTPQHQSIAWIGIERANVWIYKKGKLLFYGDSADTQKNKPYSDFWVGSGTDVNIAKKFLTNGYTGIFSVSTRVGTTGAYLLEDGKLTYHPADFPPILGMQVNKDGKITLSVTRGAAKEGITLQCFSDLSQPPIEEVLHLDEIGSAVWTNSTTLPVMLFKLTYNGN